MKYEATSPEDYLDQLPPEHSKVLSGLRTTILKNLPAGFQETISYGMLGYVVPHSRYPAGYHVNPSLPLPFINMASQKNFVALYHMGLYANQQLLDWFVTEYPKHCKRKLDMGKSCIRFKNMDTVPYALIGELCTQMTVENWINLYEQNTK